METILENRIKLDSDFDSKIYETIRILTANESKVDTYANVVKSIATFNNSTFLDVQLDISELENELLNIIADEEEDERDSMILKMDYHVLKFLEKALNVYGIKTYPVNQLLGIDLICNVFQTMNIIYTLEEGMESIVKDYCESLEDDPDAFCSMLENLGDKWKEDYLTVVEEVDPELRITLGKWLQDKEAGTVTVTQDDEEFVRFCMENNIGWIQDVELKYLSLTDFLSYATDRAMFNRNIEENIALAESFITYSYKKAIKDNEALPMGKITSVPSILALTLCMSKLTDAEPTAKVMFRQGNTDSVFKYLTNDLRLYDFSIEEIDGESLTDRVTSIKKVIYLTLKTLSHVETEEEVKYDSSWFRN